MLSLLLMASLAIVYLGVLNLNDSWLVTVTDRLAGRTGQIKPTGLPDFGSIQNVQAKKQQFFDYMLPMVRHSNNLIRSDRATLLALRNQLEGQLKKAVVLTADQQHWISRICQRYLGANSGADGGPFDKIALTLVVINELLLRIDVVPASLVLAQAAKESGWGTSRFALEANNLFGISCFSEGCGLTPHDRQRGHTRKVRYYDSIQDSVSAYIHTINTHSAYKSLREIRAKARAANRHPGGVTLAEGLLQYSARGRHYVQEIQNLIRANNLQQYTFPKSA